MKNLSLKNKIIIALAAIVILVLAYFSGGSIKNSESKPSLTAAKTTESLAEETSAKAEESTENTSESAAEAVSETVLETVSETFSEIVSETVSDRTPETPTKAAESAANVISQSIPAAEKQTEAAAPRPEAKAEPQPPKAANTCTLSVSCGTILNNLDMFDKSKMQLLPADGVVFAPKTVTFEDGESVFDVLLREMRANNIHMEFSKVPAYNSVYIEGINNIYEFDCGELSGWEYRVNGEHPRFGCDMYKLHDGDVVEWLYTCDLGRDIGDTYYDQ